jgi:hypothetical protein
MLQGQISSAQVQNLKEANKLLRIAKATNEVTMHLPSLEVTVVIWSDLGFLALSDAAWATRPSVSSQGGMMVLLTPKVASGDKAAEYSMLDWRSWKVTRVARSSLNSETQAAVEAADALEYTKTFWNFLHQPEQPVGTAIQSATRKRTVVELLVFKQTLRRPALGFERTANG